MWRRARIRRAAPLNFVWDGNSLPAGYTSTVPPSALLAQGLAARHGDMLTRNVAVPNQTWRQMDGQDGGSAADIAGDCWLPGRVNVLILWETTNAIHQGRSPQQAVADAESYVAHRLAEHPWLVVILSTIPRGQGDSQAAIDALNAGLVAADAGIRSACRGWGAKTFVDLRCPGSPFRFGAYDDAAFAANARLWAGDRIHLTADGHQVIANMLLPVIAALPPR